MTEEPTPPEDPDATTFNAEEYAIVAEQTALWIAALLHVFGKLANNPAMIATIKQQAAAMDADARTVFSERLVSELAKGALLDASPLGTAD